MANLKCRLKLFRDPDWTVSRPIVCGPLRYRIGSTF